jgi:hypothetical protein
MHPARAAHQFWYAGERGLSAEAHRDVSLRALRQLLESGSSYVQRAESKGVLFPSALLRDVESAVDWQAALSPLLFTDDEWLRWCRRHVIWHYLKGSAVDRDLFEVKVQFHLACVTLSHEDS